MKIMKLNEWEEFDSEDEIDDEHPSRKLYVLQNNDGQYLYRTGMEYKLSDDIRKANKYTSPRTAEGSLKVKLIWGNRPGNKEKKEDWNLVEIENIIVAGKSRKL